MHADGDEDKFKEKKFFIWNCCRVSISVEAATGRQWWQPLCNNFRVFITFVERKKGPEVLLFLCDSLAYFWGFSVWDDVSFVPAVRMQCVSFGSFCSPTCAVIELHFPLLFWRGAESTIINLENFSNFFEFYASLTTQFKFIRHEFRLEFIS